MSDNNNDNSTDNLSVNEINEFFEDIIEISDDAGKFIAIGKSTRCIKSGPLTMSDGGNLGNTTC